MMKWNSVEVRLPLENELLLVEVVTNKGLEVYDRVKFINGKWCKCIVGAKPIEMDRLYGNHTVVAWMYYPKPCPLKKLK